jgi:glycosyltransferase involved in cell wall biosynthesis
MKPTLVISCPASSRSGYGDHSRDLIRSLIAMDKFIVKVMDQRWGNCAQTALSIKDIDIVSRMLTANLDAKPDIWIQVTVPNEFSPVGNFNIGITAGIETTLCSAEFLEGVNRMNYVIVPSVHAKNVFENTSYDKKDQHGNIIQQLKCTTKIDVLFEGLDLEVFNKQPSTTFNLDTIKEDFAFLFVGHWMQGEFGHDRKDVGGMIRTFLETFKDSAKRNQPALILKTSSATFSIIDREQVLQKIEQIKLSMGIDPALLPNIYVVHGDLSQAELNNLYNHTKVKAMISFTHGEGFGRPLLEFSITGKPVIYSNWSGHIDFLSKYQVPLAGEIKQVHKSVVQPQLILENSGWFFVDYGYAIGVLKDVHKNYKKYLEQTRKQTQYVKDNFSLDKMTKDFTDLIDTNVPVVVVPQTNIMSKEAIAELALQEI